MGCGSSRLGGGAAARAGEGGVVPLPEGIRPLLRRRLEEMKKRSHASVLKGNQTQSTKELLRHGSSEDGEEAEENDYSLKLSAKVAPAPDHHVEDKKEVIYEKISSIKNVKEGEKVVKKQDEKIDDVISIKKEGNDEDIIVKKQGDDGLDHDDHDEGRMSNFDERMICPGSPSFRVYCINVTSSDDDDDDDDDKEKDGEDKRKSMETQSVIIEPKEITTQENESIVKKEKKERKGKRFGMALPRKYLANVTAPCYAGAGRGCMGNNTDHSRVVQEKSSQ
ncbi:unnamed protein product [Brassica oleracea]